MQGLTILFVGLMFIAASHLYFVHHDAALHHEHHCVFCLQSIAEPLPVASVPAPVIIVRHYDSMKKNNEPVLKEMPISIFLRGPPRLVLTTDILNTDKTNKI